MAKTIAINVTVKDNDTLSKTIKHLKSLGHEVDVVATSHKRAGAAADDHFHQQAKSMSGAANSTKNFSKMASSINGGSNSLVGAYAALAANIFAVTAAFNALKNAAEVAQVIDGLAASGARMGLSYKNVITQVRDASDGLLSLEQSARSTAQVMSAGFRPEQLVRLTNAAQDASFALGRDMQESMDRLTRGVIKLEPELLDELGIMVRLDESAQMYAKTLGKSTSQLTAAEKRQGFYNATMSEAEAKFGGLSNGADNSAKTLNKLAATFSDLAKNILNSVNTIATPILKIFGSSQGALLGGLFLFVATIKGQLIPALTEATTKMQSMAEKSSKLSGKVAGELLQNSNNAYSAHGTGLAEAYFKQVEEGNGSLKETIELQNKLATFKAPERDSKGRFVSKNIRGQQEIAVKKELEALKKVEIAQRTSTSLQHAADSTTAASQLKLKEAFKSAKLAALEHNAVLKLTSTSTGTLAVVSRGASTSMFFLSLAVRSAGVAFLTFLPWLGLITLVLGGLYSLIKKMAGEGYAKLTEATKAYNEVLKTSKDSLEQYNKLGNSTASMFTITSQKATIVGNSITELASSFKELEKAQANNSGVGKFIEGFKDFFNIMRTEDIKGLVRKNAEAGGSIGYWTMEKNYELIKTFEQMSKYAGADGIIKKVFGPQGPKTIEEYKKALNLLENKFKTLTSTIEAVMGAFKNLDNASADFIKSATPSTPYDAMASGLQGVTSSMSKYIEEVGKGTQTTTDLVAILSGIGSSAEQFLSYDASKTLSSYREITSEVQKIKDLGKDAAATDVARLRVLEKEELPSLSIKGLRVLDELNAQRNIFEEMQNQSIEQQGQLALAQARLSIANKSTAITRAEMDSKINAENAVIAMQAAQLTAQASILRSLVLQNEEKQKSIKAEKELIGLAGVTDDQARLAYNNAKIMALASKEDDFSRRAITRYTIQNELLRKAIDLKISNNRATAGANSLEAQAAAISSQAVGKAERDARGDIAVAESAVFLIDKKLQVIDAVTASLRAQSDIEEILLGNNRDILASSERLLKKQALKVQLLKDESVVRIANLELQKVLSQTEENKKAYQDRIDAERNVILPALLDSLRVEQELEYFKELELKSSRELTETLKQHLDLKLSLVEAENQLAVSAVERAQNFAKEMAAKKGIALSPEKERAMQIELAEIKLTAAVTEYELKIAVINMEYELLKRKASMERSTYLQQELALKNAGEDENSPYLKSLRSVIKSLDKLIGNRTEIARNADAASGSDSVSPYVLMGTKTLPEQGLYDRQQSAAVKSAKAVVQDARNALALAKTPQASEFLSFINSAVEASKSLAAVWVVGGPITSNMTAAIESLFPYLEKMKAIFADLGPEGLVMSAAITGMQNMSTSVKDAIATFSAVDEMGNKTATFAEKFTALASIASTALSTISSLYKASSDARIAGIDKEIAAEQARDGKSEASVARIAAMEKKKDSMAKKAFEVNKKLQIAAAVVSTAAGMVGVASGLAQLPYGVGIPFIPAAMAMFGALGAAQIAIIAGTSYQSSASTAATATPSTLSIGKRSDSVDLAKSNTNVGGELGYLQGAQGQGSNSSNFTRRAYGGYGHAGMIVGEKGPELFVPSTPGNVVSNDNIQAPAPINATFNISAIDATGVEEVLTNQRGHIIEMIRDAANANGQNFLESVNTAKYRRGSKKV